MLTKEQQDVIENSLWIVNTALKKQGLQNDEDLRQSAILYMCTCIERFDPSKNVEWSTFAYKNVYLYLKRFNKKERQNVERILLEDNLFYLSDQNESPKIKDFDNSVDKLEALKNFCTIEERRCIDLKLAGYKFSEIGALMNCSVSKIMSCMRSVETKARKIRQIVRGWGEKQWN